MKSLLNELYNYVQGERLCRLLKQADPEARQLANQACQEEDELEDRLEGEEKELFARYLDHRLQADFHRDLALLRCGISLGRELMTL